jgi:hypothetical protein
MMNSKTVRLLVAVEKAHDWREGQYFSWEACGIQSTDTCRICGLVHQQFRGGQNSADHDKFIGADGHDLTLRDAAALEPCIEEDREPHAHTCQQCGKVVTPECDCEKGDTVNVWCSANCKAAFDL